MQYLCGCSAEWQWQGLITCTRVSDGQCVCQPVLFWKAVHPTRACQPRISIISRSQRLPMPRLIFGRSPVLAVLQHFTIYDVPQNKYSYLVLSKYVLNLSTVNLLFVHDLNAVPSIASLFEAYLLTKWQCAFTGCGVSRVPRSQGEHPRIYLKTWTPVYQGLLLPG